MKKTVVKWEKYAEEKRGAVGSAAREGDGGWDLRR